jgi:type I restriction enzyme R subunit
LKDFTKKAIQKEYKSLDEFLQEWSQAEKKCAIIHHLRNQGILFEELAEEIGKDMDPFDLVAHIAYDQPALTRRERVNKVKKKDYFTKYGEQARAVIDALLEKYADEGIENIEDIEILKVNPFTEFGSPIEIVQMFGGRAEYDQALHEVEELIYKS